MEQGGATKRNSLYRKLLLVGMIASIALFVYFLVLFIGENIMPSGPYNTPPPVTPAPTITIAPTENVTPAPTPYVKIAPVHLYFPNQEIDMEIEPVGQDEEGRMGTLDTHLKAAWYEPGPAPGDEGNALINGHIRWKKKLGYFSVLQDMQLYDPIVTLHSDGSLRVFYVVSVDIYPLDNVPEHVMAFDDVRRVTLITCNGEFDRSIGTSVNRCIVIAMMEEDIQDFDPAYRYELGTVAVATPTPEG